jgi:hypothetical protein
MTPKFINIFKSTELTWFESRNECQKMGGDLATFSNIESIQNVVYNLSELIHVGGYTTPWWWMLNES